MLHNESTALGWQSAFIVIIIALMLSDVPRMHRLRRFTDASLRLSLFRTGVLYLWACAAAALLIAGPDSVFWIDSHISWLGSATTVAGAVLALYFAIALFPSLRCAFRPAARLQYASALRSLRHMLPVSSCERRWWILLSISAGICEEIFFRGYLPQFLQGRLHGEWALNDTNAWLLSAIAFGMAHAYQGAVGVVHTFVGGLMFSLAAILSGGLWVPIMFHIMIDLSMLWVYRPQLDHPEAAELLLRGCDPQRVIDSL